ncbi:MAG: ribose-5-phosphate isomerase RpiA [Hyphomicrobiales bacterium]
MTADEQKRAAATAALDYVKPGMKLGLGSGSTARHFIDLLGEKVRDGLEILCVPTSETTRQQAESLKIPLTTLEQHSFLDLTVDGADEFDGDFNIMKGGGGALVAEKIVASSSRYMVVIADRSKQVKSLGAFPLPIEIVPFGVKATAWKIERVFNFLGLKAKMVLRRRDGKPFVTDGGHAIVDCALGRIPDPPRLANLLSVIPGVVDHGLFIGICGIILMGNDEGVKTFRKS